MSASDLRLSAAMRSALRQARAGNVQRSGGQVWLRHAPLQTLSTRTIMALEDRGLVDPESTAGTVLLTGLGRAVADELEARG